MKVSYSAAFEYAWKLYGRREEKAQAFAAWKLRAPEVGGEDELARRVTDALAWQGPAWSEHGWQFAPYFERYIKRRKWDDEPPEDAQPKPLETFDERRKREHAEAAAKKAEREKQAAADTARVLAALDVGKL